MLVGIMGKMGAGKTLSMSVLGVAIERATGLPLYANYALAGAKRINSIDDLWAIQKGIICFDEAWITLDSRNFSSNVDLTQWVMQTRKKQVLVLYTTQHIGQIEIRMRKGTDVLIYAFKKYGKFNLQFVDYQYGKLGRCIPLKNPSAGFQLYDTFEIVSVLRQSHSLPPRSS